MITFFYEECKDFSQEKYDEALSLLPIHMMQCIKCGQKGCLTFYGTYSRTLKIHSRAVRLTVRRVICGACGGTHALLPSLIVPYSQIPKEDQQEILQKTEANESAEAVLENNNLIDENHDF